MSSKSGFISGTSPECMLPTIGLWTCGITRTRISKTQWVSLTAGPAPTMAYAKMGYGLRTQFFNIQKLIFGTTICVGTTTTRAVPSQESVETGQSSPQRMSRGKRACHASRKCLTQRRWPESGITSQSEQAGHASRNPDTRPHRVQAPSHLGRCSLGSRGTGGETSTPTLVGAAAVLMDQGEPSIKNDDGRRRENLDRKSTTVEACSSRRRPDPCSPRLRRTPQLSPLPQQLVALP